MFLKLYTDDVHIILKRRYMSFFLELELNIFIRIVKMSEKIQL